VSLDSFLHCLWIVTRLACGVFFTRRTRESCDDDRVSRVLFVCVQNAGRSQMAQSLFERAETSHEARSAGTRPAERVHPTVVDVMAELGIDLSKKSPRRLERADAEWADVVVTMGCGDECPFVPGRRYVDWELEDPAGQPLEEVRAVRDEIGRRVDALLKQL
jgi:arsenate reductase (thioredoxin)